MEITQAQKYEILEHELLNGAGLEEILKKCLEILMKSEREIHNENYGLQQWLSLPKDLRQYLRSYTVRNTAPAK